MFAQYIFRHPRYFALIILCVFAVGINSFNNIPRQEEPTLTNFVGTVTTAYPGATPDRVEALVTKPLEDEFRQISELNAIESTSSTGVSFINLRLDDTLPEQDLERVWSEVRDAMGDAATRFPPGVGDPAFDTDRLRSFTAIVAISSEQSQAVPLSLIGRLAEDFADRARNLSGTKFVEVFGEPVEEIRVEIDEDALVARGLSLAQVTHALRAADAKVSSGRASGSGTDMLIELAGDFDSLTRIRDVIVVTSDNGSATRISDLGRVYKAAITPPPAMSLIQGRPGVMVAVAMENGEQVDKWAQSFQQLLDDYMAEAPQSVIIEKTFDQSVYA